MRATLVIFAVLASSGCANTRDSRRPACESCGVEQPTWLQRIGLGHPLGKKPSEAPPARVELAPPTEATDVRPTSEASPTLSVEPIGVRRSSSPDEGVKETASPARARAARGRSRSEC